MADPIPLTREQMLERSARALGKVDAWDFRGATMVTADEVLAMVCLLASLGLPPLGRDEAVDPAGPLATFPITPVQPSLKGA